MVPVPSTEPAYCVPTILARILTWRTFLHQEYKKNLSNGQKNWSDQELEILVKAWADKAVQEQLAGTTLKCTSFHRSGRESVSVWL